MWSTCKFFISVFCLSLAFLNASSQDTIPADSICPQQDVFDLFKKKKPKAPQIPIRKFRAIVIPIVASSPSTGVQLGVGSTFSFTIGKHPETRLSAGSFQVLWTTKKQLIAYLRSNMFFSRNKFFLQTDWRWYIFRLPTYGLGTGPKDNIPLLPTDYTSPESNISYEGGEFPMKYDWVKFHSILFREMFPHFFLGFGYQLDYYYNIQDVNLVLDSSVLITTPHYTYCARHGFDPDQYISSGISLNAMFDTRDNIINAYRGMFAKVNIRYNSKVLGSHKQGGQLWAEFRKYQGLSKSSPRHVLALWLYGSFKLGGELPYLDLMSVGFDPSNSSGRGYAEGRWRGEDLIYGEIEYRFPISPCSGILGGVVYANVTSAGNRDMGIPVLGYFKPGAGVGLRIMVGKYDRTNLVIDFGFGEFSKGLYIQAAEIF